MKPVRAKGTEAIILKSIDGYSFLRVYQSDGEFTDYDIRHSDLSVTITDPDAFFYKTPLGDDIIDHSPATLGVSE